MDGLAGSDNPTQNHENWLIFAPYSEKRTFFDCYISEALYGKAAGRTEGGGVRGEFGE